MLHVVSIRCHMWLVYVRVCGVCTMVSGTATAAGSGGSFSLSPLLSASLLPGLATDSRSLPCGSGRPECSSGADERRRDV